MPMDQENSQLNAGKYTGSNSQGIMNYFSANAISLRTQKKLASQLSLNMTKFFIDDTSSRLFENVNQLLAIYTGSKKTASKLMKQIVKMNVKLAILNLNQVFNEEESSLAAELKDAFHNIAECFLRIKQPNRNRLGGPKGSIERMVGLVEHASVLISQLTKRHLSEKNQIKILQSVQFFSNQDLLETVIKREEIYKELIIRIVEDLGELVDRGLI